MADGVQIRVDARQAQIRLDRVTPAVRNRLRQVIPNLLGRLASVVNNKLSTQLKSRTSLVVNQTMTENTQEIYGTITLDSDKAGGLLPTYLEQGTSPHEILGDPVLAFPWDFMGAYGGSASANTTMAFFRKVQHPGTRAYRFMGGTFEEQQADISQALGAAIQQVSREV